MPTTCHRFAFAATLLALASVIAACGGGGGGGSAVPARSQNAAETSGTALLTIPNKTASSTARKSQFLSASAASVGVTVNGGTPSFSDVTSSSPLCSATSYGRTCSIPLEAPGGSDTFVFTLYDAPNGGGNKLGSGTAVQTVVIGTPYTVAVAVSGNVASVLITVPAIEIGPTSVPVTVVAKDAGGNTIIGPTAYENPIALTNSDATGTLTLSTTTVNTPNDVITLAYTGGALASAATISATSAGLAASSVQPAQVLPLNYFPTGLSRTYTTTSGEVDSFSPIGSAPPMASASSPPSLYSYTDSVSAGATFNGVSGLQATTVLSGSSLFLDTGETTYQSIAGGTVTELGSIVPYCTDTTTKYPNGNAYAKLPFVTGASLSSSPAYSSTEIYENSCGGGLASTTVTADASGNLSTLNTYSDGSTFTEQDNIDGTGSAVYGAGSGPCPYGTWYSNLPCAWTSATLAAAAPSGGTVGFTITQIISGSPQTASIPLATNQVYPSGVPAPYTVSSTVGAPVTSASGIPCNVTAAYTFPVVPITYVLAQWYPSTGTYVSSTEVDYLAPSIGKICGVGTYVNQIVEGLVYSTISTLPPTVGPYVFTDTVTEYDSLVSVGPPSQSGTVITTGRSRLPASLRGARLP